MSRRDPARAGGDAKSGVLLKGRAVSIKRVGRSYGRTVAHVVLDGRDVGQILIAQGIARPWPVHRAKPDWCGSMAKP